MDSYAAPQHQSYRRRSHLPVTVVLRGGAWWDGAGLRSHLSAQTVYSYQYIFFFYLIISGVTFDLLIVIVQLCDAPKERKNECCILFVYIPPHIYVAVTIILL